MTVTLEKLHKISIFAKSSELALTKLQNNATEQYYLSGEIIMHEGDRLPHRLYALSSGTIRISKIAATGKETILRILKVGEIFAAPALFGNNIAPATVTAQEACQIILIEREALLDAIQATPEIALSMLSLFNQRLQQMHNLVHGLVSERAISRLVRYIQYFAAEQGMDSTPQGDCLRSHLPYYQIARSIGITYEECVRLFKQLQPTVTYKRGGKIIVTDWHKLEALANRD